MFLKHALSWLRANAAFVCLFVVAALLRWFVWVAYNPAILILADSYQYLRAATVGTGIIGQGRPFLYSLAFKPLLAFEDLALVTAVQHLLVLALAVLLYVLQRRLDVPRVLAAIGASFVLLDGYQLNLEQHILTEALFETLSVTGLAALVWFKRGPLWVYALGGVLLSLSTMTRFVGFSLLPIAVIHLIATRVGWIRLAGALVGIAVPLVLSLTVLGTAAEDRSLSGRIGPRLYGKVATFADCSLVELPRIERRLCINKPVSKRRAFYSPWSKSPMDTLRVPPGSDKGEVAMAFATRFIKAQPVAYLRVVARDFLRFFTWTSTEQLARRPVRRWEFFDTKREIFTVRGRIGLYRKFRETKGAPPPELGLEQRFRLNEEIGRNLERYQALIYARGPMLAVLGLLGLLGALLGTEPERRQGNAKAVCSLFATSGLALYLFPAMFSTFHFRYVIAGLPLLGPAGTVGAWLLFRRLAAYYRAARKPATSS